MATVTGWNPFGVALDITATGSNVVRKSATQYTVKITASWKVSYSGNNTNYGMTASSGGGSVNLNSFGTYASSGSGSFTGTYSISGNGSATKSITVTFKNFNNDNDKSVTKTISLDVTVPAWTSYTVSYNANGGSGAPSSQTKWKDQTLTLSSTKPTRTGYTFKGWSLTKDGSVYYQPGGTCGKNENLTLYAVWEENALTVNYYSNYATSAFDTALNAVGSDKNVKVYVGTFYYDNDYSTYGLVNYSSSSGSVYMTRTGYTATKYWGTSTSGGTLVHEDTGFATGQALAKALGKDLSSGSASINIYAQWEENALTVNYYSNYADYGTFNGESLSVSANSNALILSQEFLYDNAYSNGLADVQNSNYLYLSRIGYKPTGYWGTSVDGGALVNEKTSFNTGQALAVALGKSLESGNALVNIYVQWKPSGVVYIDNGATLEPYLPYIDNGTSWELYLAYVDDGTTWHIIS